MSGEVFRVQRNVMAYWKPAWVTSHYGTTNVRMTLPEHIRAQMGGEEVVFFAGEVVSGKPVLAKRVPDPKWAVTSFG